MYKLDCKQNWEWWKLINTGEGSLPRSEQFPSICASMTCCRNDLVQVAANQVKVSSCPPSRCTTPVKYVKSSSGCNNICVKQLGGKDFTISLNPSKMNLSIGPGGRCREQPLSIVINTTPKGQVTVHPVFESLADKKGAGIVAAARRNLATKIHSPADNLHIQLMGGSLTEQLGEPPSYNRKMLVKNCGVVSRQHGGPNYSPCRARSQITPNIIHCKFECLCTARETIVSLFVICELVFSFPFLIMLQVMNIWEADYVIINGMQESTKLRLS